MSGHPYPQGVAEIVQSANMINELDAEDERLTNLINESKAALEKVRASRSSNAEKVHKLITKMDCAAMGNYGWEVRVVNLMAMIVEEAKK